jgi:hypothetical protein
MAGLVVVVRNVLRPPERGQIEPFPPRQFGDLVALNLRETDVTQAEAG